MSIGKGTGGRVTKGFRPLVPASYNSDEDVQLAKHINEEFDQLINHVSQVLHLRTAPSETKQSLALSKNAMRSAAHHIMTALAFKSIADTQTETPPDE